MDSNTARSPRGAFLSPWRRTAAWAIATAGLPLLTVVLVARRDRLELSSALLLYLLVVVAIAAVGGTGPALASAVVAFGLANWFFTEPVQTFRIDEPHNLLALTVFLVVAVVVSRFMAVATRRSAEATRATAEAETLARLAGSLTEADPLPRSVELLRATFDLEGVAVLHHAGAAWVAEATAGAHPPAHPDGADMVQLLATDLVLALNGAGLGADDRRVLEAFTAQLAAAVVGRQLASQAAQAEVLKQTDEVRSALLQAVSHDLRTPLASIKASVSSLRQHDVTWTPDQTEEFLATVEHETDRLTGLVENLLDMSRIQTGAFPLSVARVGLEEVVPAALGPLGSRARRVEVDLPETLPEVRADPLLLERVVANLIDNALAHTAPRGAGPAPPAGPSVRIEAHAVAGRVILGIMDRGPGIAPADRERVFQPFQRLGDSGRAGGAGVGLGLAVARGFSRAMGGDVRIEDRAGGGAAVLIDLPAAPAVAEDARS